ncbi:unnamed protein product [Caenorhabditis angaria]|uniref:Uncharacterized protein n=1 Tax=Caenorhabditis angaria TaxID=860376 RepID=A0A9P1J4X7_9PELO|nr:unnamed protein product [Caenorhabditis angaria]
MKDSRQYQYLRGNSKITQKHQRTSESKLSYYWEHMKAKNYTIIDPEFFGIVDNVTYNKEEFIKKSKGYKFPDKMPQVNVTNAIFDMEGMLIGDIDQYGHTSKFTAKPNANIKGGYTFFKVKK